MHAEQQDEAGFVSRVRVIETQPLSERAEAYSELHAEFTRRLDATPRQADAS